MSAARPTVAFDNCADRMAQVLLEHGAFEVTDAILALLGKFPPSAIAELLDAAIAKARHIKEAC